MDRAFEPAPGRTAGAQADISESKKESRAHWFHAGYTLLVPQELARSLVEVRMKLPI